VKESARQLTEAILNNPKTGYFVYAITSFEIWWIDWGKPLIDGTASILGVILLAVLIRKHWYGTDTSKNSKLDKQG
jgi:hypothetical protein